MPGTTPMRSPAIDAANKRLCYRYRLPKDYRESH